MSDPATRSPHFAAALSALLPGLGQLYNGERTQGLAVLTMTAGILAGVALALWGPQPLRSRATVVLLLFIYPFVWWPAVAGARRGAAGVGDSWLSRGESWYTVLMLVTIGPMALPLLWQNPRFSRRAKRVWTAVVIAAALLGVVFALLLGPWLEHRLREMLELLVELLAEQTSGCWAVGVPPGCRVANLPLSLLDDHQAKPQRLIPQILEKLPAVDDLATLGLGDRLEKKRLLLL